MFFIPSFLPDGNDLLVTSLAELNWGPFGEPFHHLNSTSSNSHDLMCCRMPEICCLCFLFSAWTLSHRRPQGSQASETGSPDWSRQDAWPRSPSKTEPKLQIYHLKAFTCTWHTNHCTIGLPKFNHEVCWCVYGLRDILAFSKMICTSACSRGFSEELTNLCRKYKKSNVQTSCFCK